MSEITDETIKLPRFQEGGAGRFAAEVFKQFLDFDLTAEQLVWIERYYKNVSDKGLW